MSFISFVLPDTRSHKDLCIVFGSMPLSQLEQFSVPFCPPYFVGGIANVLLSGFL